MFLNIWLHRLIVVVLCTGLLVLTSGPSYLVFAQSSSYEAALAKLDGYMSLLEQLKDSLDRTQFDLNELSLELAFEDPETIIQFVQDKIYFEQYVGMLRGAEGTLMGRAGNALEQAVLLERLLSDSGAETRFARTVLSDEQAQALVNQMLMPKPELPPVGNLAAMGDIIEQLSEFTDYDQGEFANRIEQALVPQDVSSSERYTDTLAVSEELVTTLEKAGLGFGDSDVESVLIEEAKDYVWLEYRFDNQEWQSAHPAAANLDLTNLEASQYFTDGIPEELKHHLRVEVEIEQVGDSSVTQEIMTPFEMPIADLSGRLLTYTNAPDGASDDATQTLAEILEKTTYFIPIFNETFAEGGQFFDLSGNIKPPQNALTETVGGLGESAGGLLGGGLGGSLSEDAEEPAETNFSAQWITYTLIAPSGEETSHSRTVVDLIGAENRLADNLSFTESATDVSLALLSQQRFMVAAFDYPLGFIIDQTLSRILETRSLLEFILAQAYEVEQPIPDNAAIKASSNLEHLSAYHLFDSFIATNDGLGYRAEPSILVISSGFRGTTDDATEFSSIDIVNNGRRIYQASEQGIENASLAAVQTGVWETLVERDLSGDKESINTLSLFAKAAEQGIGTRVLTTNQVEEVESLALSAEAKVNLVRDLEAGFSVIIPETMPTPEMTGWWRVNLTTGETLGMTSDGRGQDFVEYALGVYDKAATIAFALAAIEKCLKTTSGLAQLCCLMKVYMNTIYGYGIGSAVGKLGGAAMGLGFTLITGFLDADYVGLGGINCDSVPSITFETTFKESLSC